MKFELPLEVYILGLILALMKGSALGWFTKSFFTSKNERRTDRKPKLSKRFPHAKPTGSTFNDSGKPGKGTPTRKRRWPGASSR